MPRFERATDQFGFPIPAQLGDLPDARRADDAFGKPTRGQLGATGLRIKRWLIFGLIGITLLILLVTVFADPLRELLCDYQLQRGAEAYDEGDFDGARGHFDTAVDLRPERVEAHYHRAKTLFELREYDAARTDLEPLQTHAFAPLAARVHEQLAWIDFRQNRFELALRHADQAVGRNRNDPQSLNARAYLCALTGLQLDKGLQDIEQALARTDSRQQASLLDTRGYLRFKKGDLQDALDDLNLAIRLSLIEYRMTDFSEQGMFAGASPAMIAHARERMRQSLGVMYHHRYEVYQAMKNDAEAEADRAKSIEFGYDPESSVF